VGLVHVLQLTEQAMVVVVVLLVVVVACSAAACGGPQSAGQFDTFSPPI
jgi:hypothetical protein